MISDPAITVRYAGPTGSRVGSGVGVGVGFGVGVGVGVGVGDSQIFQFG